MNVVGLDAGIDDRPNDVIAAGLEGGAGGVGLHRRDRAEDQRNNLEILPDLVDRARHAKLLDLPRRRERASSEALL